MTLPRAARRGADLARRSMPVWGLSLLLFGAAVRTTVSAVVRADDAPERGLYISLALACFALAAVAWTAGARIGARLRLVLLLTVVGVTTTLVATANGSTEVVISAFAYPWGALYAAHVMDRRAAFGFAAGASASFAVGISVIGWAGLAGAWLMVSLTVLLVTVATSAAVTALRDQSETDPLTGIANRAGFHRMAAQMLASADRHCRPMALLLCDLDGLKQINDSGGHAAGDTVLVDVVLAWSPVLRQGDVLARIGGDEFALLLPDTDLEAAELIVDRLHAATAAAFSAGAATRQAGESLSQLLVRADAAMYARKGGHQPSALAMRSFMTSVAPPPIPRMRASR